MTSATACAWLHLQDSTYPCVISSYASKASDNDFLLYAKSATSMDFMIAGKAYYVQIRLPTKSWVRNIVIDFKPSRVVGFSFWYESIVFRQACFTITQ